MASSVPEQSAATTAQSPSQPQQTGSRPSSSQAPLSTSPVEMRTLQTTEASGTTPAAPTSGTVPSVPTTQNPEDGKQAQSTQPSESIAPSSPTKLAPPTALNRTETEAIGPSTDTPAAKPDNTNGPVVVITLLLTTGARHPYKIDEKYLKKRNVNVEAMDPYNISVYTLKELIWRDWREGACTMSHHTCDCLSMVINGLTCIAEWESRPTSPSSIRLIHFGRMLDDKSPLKECRFQTEAPNVVHMTVKPQEIVDEEDAKTGKGGRARGEDGEESHAGCRCIIL
ncbi:hypothetical protein BDV96DRAFT_485040 [Lophiotrema nucula]|uniref:UBL3-like ubiquitin domain-containing protein n=1 Tax=Lophiotrema nucula TaxID=690887 RepID=A0A6A5ZPG5_9PLEO|nr:hypothetical protein BDV96DRAFT_485040 [Lophiotrema nucula]